MNFLAGLENPSKPTSTRAINVQIPEDHWVTCAARAPPREIPAPHTQGPDLEDSNQGPRQNSRLREQLPSAESGRPASRSRGGDKSGGWVFGEDRPPRRSRSYNSKRSKRRRRGRGPVARRPEACAPLWPAMATWPRLAARSPGRPPHLACSLSLAVWSARSLAGPQAYVEARPREGRCSRHWRATLRGRAPPLCDTARQSLSAVHAALQSGVAVGAGGCWEPGAFSAFGGCCQLGVARMLILYLWVDTWLGPKWAD